MVPESDEGDARVFEELVKRERRGLGVSEMEDEDAASDAELQGVCRRVLADWSPMDAEADDEGAVVVVVAVEEEHGLDPFFDDGGGGGFGDGYGGSVQGDIVDCGH